MFEVPSPVRGRAVTNGSGSTVDVNYPADVEAGDILVCALGADTLVTVSASGWTILDQSQSAADTGCVMWRTADGSEGGDTFEVTLSISRAFQAVVWSVIGSGPPVCAVDDGTTYPVAPPNLAPAGGSARYWWATGIVTNEGNWIRDWAPGVGGWVLVQPSNGSVGLSTAERVLSASSFQPGEATPVGFGSQHWLAYTIAVPAPAPAGTNFPTIEDVAVSVWSSGASSQTVNLPSLQAGDLLVAEIGASGNVTPAISGWTQLFRGTVDGNESAAVLYKVADGSEGATATVTWSGNQVGAAVVRSYGQVDLDKLDFATDSGTATAVTFPELTPDGGADDILWVAGFSSDSNVGQPRGSWPLGYSSGGGWAYASDAGVFSGVNAVNAASQTPASAPIEASRRFFSWTIALYPTPPPTPPPSSGNRMGGTGAIRRRGGHPR